LTAATYRALHSVQISPADGTPLPQTEAASPCNHRTESEHYVYALGASSISQSSACRSSQFNSRGSADAHHVSSGIHCSRLRSRKESGYTARR
jgi:hypothetical protein